MRRPSGGLPRHPAYAALAAIALLSVVSAVWIGRGGNAPAKPLSAATQPTLSLQRSSPDAGEGEVATDAALLLQFNAPVHPLTVAGEAGGPPPMTIDPPLPGAGAWLTSSLYRFRPADGWQGSAAYRVTIDPSLRGTGGQTLAAPASFAFTTVSPAVADVSPAPNTEQAPTRPSTGPRPPAGPNLNQLPVTGSITVRFNQAVNQAVAAPLLSFQPPISGSSSWTDERTLVFQPGAPLSRATTYTGTVAAGVPSVTGTAASTAPYTWTFVTAPEAGISGSEPPAGATAAPSGSIQITFATPMDKASVEQRISLEPAPERNPGFFWQPGDQRLHINFFPGRPSTDYRLTLAAGAVDRFGQTIAAPVEIAFRTAPLRPSVTLIGPFRGGVFQATTEQRAVLQTTNVERVNLALYSLSGVEFRRWIEPSRPPSLEPRGSTLREWPLDVSAEQNQPRTTLAGLGDGRPLAPGYYLLAARSPSLVGPPVTMPFVVTRTHLTVKRNHDALLVWALDYATGEPVAGLPLRAVTPDGTAETTGVTDGQGLAGFPAPPPLSPNRVDPIVVTGERDGDAIFLSTAWYAGGGFPYQPGVTGSLTTERPIYRPGETVYYQGVARLDQDATLSIPPADPGWSLVVQDPRGRELVRRPVALDDFGAFWGEIDLDEQAAAGGYFMRVETASNRGASIYGNFEVASFRRPEFGVLVSAERPDWEHGESIAVRATAELFLGAPLPDAAVTWRVTTTPYQFAPAGFEGFSFIDPDQRGRRDPFGARLEGTGRTDSRGSFAFTVPADLSGDAASLVFAIEATVTDSDNQQVSARTTVRVHKAARYAGVRPRDYLGVAGRPLTLDAVTLDRGGKPAPGEALTLTIAERRYNTVKVRDAAGDEVYDSVPEDRDLETRALTTGADGRVEFTFTPPAGGLYRFLLEGRDAAGNVYRSATLVYSAGPGYIPWRVTNDDRLELVADRRIYAPGDTARVLVPAPFADATGLVTVERAGILSTSVRPFTGNSVVLDIPIERGYVPNVYVTVSLFKPGTSDNPIPQFRFGQVMLSVSAEEQRLAITLTPDKTTLGPRDTVTFAIETRDAAGTPVAAELALALVDEAILSLSDSPPVDVFARLYGQRGLGVQTSAQAAVSLDQVADRARATDGEGKGGSGGGGEDETRSDFRFTAHWEPALRTGADGKGTLAIRLPDTLTAWRLTARGITLDSRAGMASTSITTTKPLIVRPVAPRFFTAGDQPQLGAIVLNLSGSALDAIVGLSGDGIAPLDGVDRQVRLEPGARQTVTWKLAAMQTGVARPRWSAVGGGLADAVQLTLPVRALTTAEVTASAGAVRDSLTEIVRGPTSSTAQVESLTLDLWPSLTAALPETVRYLREFPFESAELTASRLITEVALAMAQGGNASTEQVLPRIQRLYAVQHSAGGWGWWSADAADPAITAYVLLALRLARDAGQQVDQDVLNRAATFLRGELDRVRSAATDLNPTQRAFFVAALSLSSANETGRLFALAERRDTLGAEGKAWLALAMLRAGVRPDDPRARPLLTDITSAAAISAAGASWDDSAGAPARLTTATRSTAVALWALTLADPESLLVDNATRWLMGMRRDGQWASTQESALAVLALSVLARARDEGAAAYTYRVALNDQELRTAPVAAAGAAPADRLVVRDALQPGDNRLTLSRTPADAAGRLYYQLSYRSTTGAGGVGARDNGIAVAREFLSADGADTPINRVKAGEIVKVRITVLAPATRQYVTVEDFLPAGLEPVDVSLATTSRAFAELQLREAERQARLRGGNCRIGYRACISPFTNTSISDDRIALFARELPKGAHEFVYFARATTAGAYLVRPSRAEETYFPDVWGRTDSGTFVVE